MQAEQEAMQQAKSGIVVADMYKPRGGAEMSLDRRTEGVLRREDNRFLLRNEQNEQMDASQERKKALTETDELIRRLEERNKARNKVGTVVRQSTEVAPLTRVTAPTLPVRGAQEDVAIDPVSLDGKASFDSARFLYQEEIEKAGKNMERVHALLEKRKKKGIASLLEKGYKGLPKALEIFKGVKPRYKIAMGVALAGASVATGGFTSALSIGLSTLSYSSGFYKKMIDAEMKKNPNVNKSHVAARAIGYGLVTALASSALIAGLFEGVDVPGAIDGAVAKVESAKDSISNWFSSFTSSPDLVYTGPVGDGINGLDLPYEPINGLDLPPEPNSAHLDGVVTGDGVPNNLSQGSHSSPWTTVQATPSSSVEMVSSPGSTGGLDSVTTETYEPHMTAQSSGAPFDAHESYMTSQSSAPFAENESYMTSPSQPVDNLDGAVTGQGTPNNLSNDGTLLDSSGNPIRSGSGGVVQSGGFADNRP
jgi:hypothetical protein